jgi:type IV fimbrial biogenesis protein FimT
MNTSTSSLNLVHFAAFPCGRSKTRSRGFTVIEVLAVMAIAAILVGVGAPAMTATLRSVELSSATNDLMGSLLLARSEAVKRKGRVVLCKSPDGASCAQAGGWQQGWIVFHDANNNGLREAGEVLIVQQEALSTNLRLTGNVNVANYVSFAPNGATKLVGGNFQAGTLTVCNQSLEAEEARQIVVNAVGRARVQKATVASCI